MQDKRVVTDCRHLKVRIAKNNLACLLVRDTFSVFGNSKYEVSISIGFKRCIPFAETLRRFQKILAVYYLILEVHHIYIKEYL